MSHSPSGSAEATLTRGEVAERVRPIIAEQGTVLLEELRDEHLLMEILDSLGTVEASMEIEDEFDICIPDEALDRVKTVGDLIDGVCLLLEGQAE
jgi:acyl carrier protein